MMIKPQDLDRVLKTLLEQHVKHGDTYMRYWEDRRERLLNNARLKVKSTHPPDEDIPLPHVYRDFHHESVGLAWEDALTFVALPLARHHARREGKVTYHDVEDLASAVYIKVQHAAANDAKYPWDYAYTYFHRALKSVARDRLRRQYARGIRTERPDGTVDVISVINAGDWDDGLTRDNNSRTAQHAEEIATAIREARAYLDKHFLDRAETLFSQGRKFRATYWQLYTAWLRTKSNDATTRSLEGEFGVNKTTINIKLKALEVYIVNIFSKRGFPDSKTKSFVDAIAESATDDATDTALDNAASGNAVGSTTRSVIIAVATIWTVEETLATARELKGGAE